MNVRETVVNEFRSVFERNGYSTTPEFLRVAESPFNLIAVQRAIDLDLENIRQQAKNLPSSEIERRVREKDRVHEEQLRQLSRQYALRLLEFTRRGLLLSESRAITEQANLKAMAGRSCDVYPCSI